MDELRRASDVARADSRSRLRERHAALPAGGPRATRRALARLGDARAIVLVEGISDEIALETLAARRGRDLDEEGVAVVPIGGAQAIGRFLSRFGPQGLDVRLAGLCDAGEEDVFRRCLERAGLGSALTRARMAELGFHVCVADLEDELIRALGPEAVVAVVAAEGDLAAFRTFQKQPAWRGRAIDAQLRRFLGSADRRKLRYARLLVDALDPARVPRPLDRVLAHV
jgi:Overcoming lysogenization defect protein-like, TOPRIM domain